MIEASKKAVEYFFVQKYGSPAEELWHHEGTVGDIIRDIQAPLGSRSAIVEILRNIIIARNDIKDWPDVVWTTIIRCWQIDPSKFRIKEDIERFPRALYIIIENNGCVVPDMNFRHGRRVQSHDNKRVLKHKIKSRQRFSTQ